MLSLLLMLQVVPTVVGCDDPNDRIMAGQMELEDGVPCRRPRIEMLERPAPSGPISPARQAAIQRFMDADLFDGPRTRWHWVPQQGNGRTYCGWVNPLNRMGGHVGWHPFIVTFEGNRSPVVSDARIIERDGPRAPVIICEVIGYDVSSPPRR